MLEPLKNWYCDKCGSLIKNPEDGYVQFKKRCENGVVYEDFVIVHHYSESPLKGKTKDGCYIYDSDCSLTSFLGDEGKVRSLILLDQGEYLKANCFSGTSNFRKWNDFFKRLQVPYYEEARRNITRAINDGYLNEEKEIQTLLPEELKNMIIHYEQKDYILEIEMNRK